MACSRGTRAPSNEPWRPTPSHGGADVGALREDAGQARPSGHARRRRRKPPRPAAPGPRRCPPHRRRPPRCPVGGERTAGPARQVSPVARSPTWNVSAPCTGCPSADTTDRSPRRSRPVAEGATTMSPPSRRAPPASTLGVRVRRPAPTQGHLDQLVEGRVTSSGDSARTAPARRANSSSCAWAAPACPRQQHRPGEARPTRRRFTKGEGYDGEAGGGRRGPAPET